MRIRARGEVQEMEVEEDDLVSSDVLPILTGANRGLSLILTNRIRNRCIRRDLGRLRNRRIKSSCQVPGATARGERSYPVVDVIRG